MKRTSLCVDRGAKRCECGAEQVESARRVAADDAPRHELLLEGDETGDGRVRLALLLDTGLSGLPAFLIRDSGVNSGFMIAQVTSAALVAESRVLSHPASVDSIPSSAGREDHVSMGMTAAQYAKNKLAIEENGRKNSDGLRFYRDSNQGRAHAR